MTDITLLIIALFWALVIAISLFVLPWVKSKVGTERMGQFLAWVDIAVRAAEQVYKSTEGAKKKEFVLQYLEDRGFYVDTLDLDLAIEAAVHKLHQEMYGTVFLKEER